MKRLFLILAAVTVCALPARGETETRACIAAIHAAAGHHRAGAIPADCWRLGPLTLGMSRTAAENALDGPPDAQAPRSMVYRRRKFALTETLYVYPRTLLNRLRLAPARNFHPTILALLYRQGALVGVSVGDAARMDGGPLCTPSAPGRAFDETGTAFPYSFHGVALGSPLAAATRNFGRFASVNASRDFANYWPVPLSFMGDKQIDGMDIAAGMAFVSSVGLPQFQLRRDPHTCLVIGYTLSVGR